MDGYLLVVDRVEACRKALPAFFQLGRDAPVLLRLEGADVPLPLDDQPQRNGLHAACRESLLYRLPEKGAGLVANEPVEYATRLLRVDEPHVDVARTLHGRPNRVLRDLMKEHTPHRRAALALDVLRHVPADRLALTIRV